MKTQKNLLNLIIYLIVGIAVLGIKYFYRNADAGSLAWILAPTVWWVRILSGISFVYDPCEGYISHTYQFVIAPSCSGLKFMLITISMLIFPFIHSMETPKRKLGWTFLSVPASYILTILVNTCRIVISIYLPIYLEQKNLISGSLSSERLHTLIGTVVYFTSLFVIYQLASHLVLTGRTFSLSFSRWLPPVFFYLVIVLGIPFLNGAFFGNPSKFTAYSRLILSVCLVVLAVYFITAALKKAFSLIVTSIPTRILKSK